MVNGSQPPHRSQATLRHLTLDANYTATGGVGAANLVVDDMVVRGGRCWGVAIVGPGMSVTRNAIQYNGRCRDTIYGGAVTAANQVDRNVLSSWYGVLLIGNDEANPWAVPATNVISANTIVATVLPCADDSEPVGPRANSQAGCTPTYF